jgi:hypothetical protein
MVVPVFMLCCCLVELLLATLIVVLALYFNFLWVSMGTRKKIGAKIMINLGLTWYEFKDKSNTICIFYLDVFLFFK